MNASARRRIPTWKILLGIAGVVLVVLGACGIWFAAAANRRYAEAVRKAKEQVARVRDRDRRRPVLHGESRPGNAWEDYAPALAQAGGIKDLAKLGLLVDRLPSADRSAGETALRNHEAAIDLLRRGAARERSDFGYDWDEGFEAPTPALLACVGLMNLSILKSRALLDGGSVRDSATLLLDLCQFGRDLGDDGPLVAHMVGNSILGGALNEFRDLVMAKRLDADTLRAVEEGLSALDGSFPRQDRALTDEALMDGISQLKNGAPHVAGRLMAADLFDRLTGWGERGAAAEQSSWPESNRVNAELAAESQGSWNPLARIAVPGRSGVGKFRRQRLAQLRLLRTAVHFQRTGEVMALGDPFGGGLQSSCSGTTLKVWSVGPDGVDDGGTGDWTARGKDIVLDCER